MRVAGASFLGPGLAVLAFGVGVSALTLLSLGQDHPSFTCTEWSARLAPALAIYPISIEKYGRWRTGFWTAALCAYLLHFWWAVAVTYRFDFEAIAARQGWVAYANYAVTVIWTADVLLGFSPLGRGLVGQLVRPLAWASVSAAFIGATAVFRSGAAAVAGWAVLALLIGALIARLLGYRIQTQDQAPAA